METPPLASRWNIWLGAMRLRTLPAAVSPVLVGGILAWHDGYFDPAAVTLCLLFALLIQIGANFANDYYDFLKGADTKERVGPIRAVASGQISPANMRTATWLVLGLGFGFGLLLVAWGGPWLVVIGVMSVVFAIAYTGGTYPLGYHGFGDVLVFIFFGLVAVGATYYVQSGQLTLEVMVMAIPIGLLATNILLVNNYRDIHTDRIAGKMTTVVRFGRRCARGQFMATLLISFSLPIALVINGTDFRWLLPCLLIPMAWNQYKRLVDSKTPSELIKLLGDTGKLLALYALLFALGVVISRS